jgi:hypothetical protein
MSNLHRGHSIDDSYPVLVVAMLVNRSLFVKKKSIDIFDFPDYRENAYLMLKFLLLFDNPNNPVVIFRDSADRGHSINYLIACFQIFKTKFCIRLFI